MKTPVVMLNMNKIGSPSWPSINRSLIVQLFADCRTNDWCITAYLVNSATERQSTAGQVQRVCLLLDATIAAAVLHNPFTNFL
jgi:hypothetical protein